MSIHTLCRLATGEFTDARIACDLAVNPPPAGFVWVEGDYSPLTQRALWVPDDFGNLLAQPIVVAQQPVPPPSSEWVDWALDATGRRWCEVPKLKLLQANARQPLLQVLIELDGKQARPVGEIATAQALGEAMPEAAVARLQAIASDKTAVRSRLAAIEAVETVQQLNALLAQPLALQTLTL